MKKTAKRVIGAAAAALALGLLIAAAVFVDGAYRAEAEAFAAIRQPAEGVTVREQDGMLLFVPEQAQAGLVFYPGGRVQAEAYAPLLEACAERGIACVLVQMPLNAAVLDPNAADRAYAAVPEVTDWVIGGHSLGGAVAANYAAAHGDRVKGLVMLAAYATQPVQVPVLSIYGSEDRVLNREKYDAYRSSLPENTTELVIEGGSHAQFGTYGAQNGDGVPTVSRAEQQSATADAIAAWMGIGK